MPKIPIELHNKFETSGNVRKNVSEIRLLVFREITGERQNVWTNSMPSLTSIG